MTAADETGAGSNLEPTIQQFIDSPSGKPPWLLPPAEARLAFVRMQSLPVGKPRARIDDMSFPTGPTGSVAVRMVRPLGAKGTLPVIIYCHGGGWICGDVDTHDRLIRELAVGAEAALVFIGYDRSPEARFPVAVEQVYAAAHYVTEHARELSVDAMRLAIVGDDVGGTIAAAVTMMARERRGPKIDLQVLVCPVTDTNFGTESYRRYGNGPWLTEAAMEHVWDAYLPDPATRANVTAVPLRTSIEQLANLPDALVIVAENDVTRDEGECYARKLTDAGVRVTSVRYNGTIHDFVVVNALADTPAARGAIAQIISALRAVFI